MFNTPPAVAENDAVAKLIKPEPALGVALGAKNDVRAARYTFHKGSTNSGSGSGKGSTNSMSLVNKGGSGCTSSKKCTRCQGDCDRDSDCSEGLLCWQRNGKEHVPGCMIGGGGDVNNYDFCYAPMKGAWPRSVQPFFLSALYNCNLTAAEARYLGP